MPGAEVGAEVGRNIVSAAAPAVSNCPIYATYLRYQKWKVDNNYVMIEAEAKVRDDNKFKDKKRWYSLTICNPTEEDFKCFLIDKWRYCVAQVEKCPKTGTLHLQAGIYYTNERVLPVRSYPRAYIEPTEYPEVWIAYCKKEETRVVEGWELGKPPRQGEKTELAAMAEQIMSRPNAWHEIMLEAPGTYVRNWKGLHSLAEKKVPQRKKAPVTYWIATTSDHAARTIMEQESVYYKDKTKDWTGYEGQHTILFDQYEGELDEKVLRTLMSWRPFRGKTTSGWVQINSPILVFVSEELPKAHYSAATAAKMTVKDLRTIVIEDAAIQPADPRGLNDQQLLEWMRFRAWGPKNQEDEKER